MGKQILIKSNYQIFNIFKISIIVSHYDTTHKYLTINY